MGDTSDGAFPSVKKKQHLKKQDDRARSSSLGSVSSLSTIEIQKIIGVNTSDKEHDITNDLTLINKLHHSETETSETLTESTSTSSKHTEHKQTDKNSDIQGNVDLFKPSFQIERSPPQNEDTRTPLNKRSRLEMSPEASSNSQQSKRQCEGTQRTTQTEDCESKQQDNDNNEENILYRKTEELQHSTPTTEDFITAIFQALDNIQLAASHESNKKPHLQSVTDDIIVIHKCLTMLTCKIGHLEREKLELEHKFNTQQVNNTYTHLDNITTEETLKNTQHPTYKTQKTYAQIAHTDTTNLPTNKTPTTWSTPKTVKKIETIIQIKNVSNPKETLHCLKNELSLKDLDGGFRNIRYLKSGALVLESCNKAQQDKLKAALKDKNNITVKESKNVYPMFTITGVLKGSSNEELVEELLRLNEDIKNDLSTPITADKITVVSRRQCRNQLKENIILQAEPEIVKWFLKKETINFDLTKLHVEEHFNLAICYNCSGLGHVAKYCKEKKCCYKCTGEHDAKDCQATEWQCPNCIKMKLPHEMSKHSAIDTKCPVYQRRLVQYKNQIDYGNNFL